MNIQKKLKTPEGTAFAASLVTGFFVHLFGLVNVIHNYDDIFAMPYHYGSGVPSGRWALQFMGEGARAIGGGVNLHVFNGLLFLALIALAAGFLVSTLSVKDKKLAALIGMLLAVFPTSASVLIHRFTSVYYGIGILLAVLAAWLPGRVKGGLLLSVLCTAVSLGTYQAFVPITISVFVLLLIRQALSGESGVGAVVKRGLYYALALVLGLAAYYLIQKLSMAILKTELLDYQGINEMGRLSLGDLPGMVINALYLVCMLPFRDYCGLSDAGGIQLAYLVLGALTAGMVAYLLIVKIRKIGIALVTAGLCILFLIAVNFIYIMCPDSAVYTLMVYSFALLACGPVVIFECIPREEKTEGKRKLLSKTIAVAIAVLVLGYAYTDNTNYEAIYYADRQTENYMNAMITQVRMTEGFDTDKEWAILGEIQDPLQWFMWQPQLTYGGFTGPKDLLNCHSTTAWMHNYFGYFPPMADEDRIAELSRLEEVKAMPCWPNEGSIKAIGNTIVIKCSELA